VSLPEKTSSRLERIRPYLQSLDSRAQRVALLACFYAAPPDPELIRENKEALDKVTRAWRALRILHAQLLKVRKSLESSLSIVIQSLPETIRFAHIPQGSSALLPIPELAGLENYFRLKGVPDPSDLLDEFVKLWPQIEAVATLEANVLKNRVLELRALLEGRVRNSWQSGRLEYVLHQLFMQFSTHEMLDQDIEEQIELASRELDRRWRDIDEGRGGCQGVRQAIMQVERNKKYRQQCEVYLRSQLAIPSK
jgi:hypothetical protein